MNSKPLVIYHGNCADGFSAAWCFWKKYGPENVDFHFGDYKRPPPDVMDREVYLVDFSYKRPIVEAMLKTARSVTLIDHHKSAIEDLKPLKERIARTNGDGLGDTFGWYCDTNRSGATLAWDFLFHRRERPLLLGHVEDRDLWRFKLAGTREIQACVFSYEYTFETYDKLMSAGPVELLQMTAAGAAIERKHHKDIKELLAYCRRRMQIAGHNVPVANLPYVYSSDAGEIMSIGEPFAACYTDTLAGRDYSLRSAPNGLDVSVIAATFGGGGHEHAAGFSVPWGHPLSQ